MADAEGFFEEVPDQGELEEGVAVNARAGGGAMGVGSAEGFDDELVKGLLDVEKIVGDSELATDKGCLCPAARAGMGALLGGGDFHGDAEDAVAGVFEEHGSDGAVDTAAHEDNDLPGGGFGFPGLKGWRKKLDAHAIHWTKSQMAWYVEVGGVTTVFAQLKGFRVAAGGRDPGGRRGGYRGLRR